MKVLSRYESGMNIDMGGFMEKHWNIVICDDDRQFLDFFCGELRQELQRLGMENSIFCYEDDRLLDELNQQQVDVFFLDIDLPQVSGLDLAEAVKKRYPSAVLVFVSNHGEKVFEAIHCQPFRFIRKEYLQQELGEALESIKKLQKTEERSIRLKINNQQIPVFLSNILYVESQAHYLIFHILNRTGQEEELRCRGKISEYEKALRQSDFLMPGKSYLVNCTRIATFSMSELVMCNGDRIRVSREYKEQTKSDYMEYMRRRLCGDGKCND